MTIRPTWLPDSFGCFLGAREKTIIETDRKSPSLSSSLPLSSKAPLPISVHLLEKYMQMRVVLLAGTQELDVSSILSLLATVIGAVRRPVAWPWMLDFRLGDIPPWNVPRNVPAGIDWY
jgi:hypothetical protein